MSITLYTGVMGSGKTYEAVSTAMLTALKAGRRIVTNIDGISSDAIISYLAEKFNLSISADSIVLFKTHESLKDDFFYDPDLDQNIENFIVHPGDLLVFDEIWEIWSPDKKILPSHTKFFRMHRHYTHADSGASCDLIICTQDVSSLHRSIRGVIELTAKFTKLKAVGLNSSYRVEMYEGTRTTKANRIQYFIRKYDSEIFPLYKSYTNSKGIESVVDERQNLLKNKWFVISFAAAIIFVFAGLYKVLNLFTPKIDSSSQAVKSSLQTTENHSSSNQSSQPQSLYLIGFIHNRTETFVIYRTQDGSIIYEQVFGGVLNGFSSSFTASSGETLKFTLGKSSDAN